MKTFNLKRATCLIAALFTAALFITGCTSLENNSNGGDDNCKNPCPAIATNPTLNFRVVDKTTNQDLFFGASAKYTPSQLKVTHVVNGAIDSAKLLVDNNTKTFAVSIMPAHRTDTVMMQIASNPQDVLLFQTATTGGCCPLLILTSVSFNGTTVFNGQNGTKTAILHE